MASYKDIFKEKIVDYSTGKLFAYDTMKGTWEYTPFSHACGSNGLKDLVKLLRRHLVFYCYSEEEIQNKNEKGNLNDLYLLAQRAYKERIPKRATISEVDDSFDAVHDGVQSELLLDLLIQLYVPNSQKFGVRAAYRQRDDNQELKGYDSLYFTVDKNREMELWLGQAKLGDYNYCKKGIIEDLVSKYNRLYMADDLFFIIDKIADLSSYKIIWKFLDEANASNCANNPDSRADDLIKTLKRYNVKICIPCLLAYSNKSIYTDPAKLRDKLYKEIDKVKKVFETKSVPNYGLDTKILFYIFPLECLDLMRSDERGGLYEGLPVRTRKSNK